MIDDFDCYAAGGGFVEGAGGVAVEGGPGLLVDFCFERGFQGFVGVIGTQEIGMADEEALLVVVRVDEPAGDAFGAIAPHLAGVGVEDIHAVDL